jgi:hypothetical protein
MGKLIDALSVKPETTAKIKVGIKCQGKKKLDVV